MAALRIHVEVDGAVHPELYLTLSAVDDDIHRAERLRQLASTGLIWERLRLADDQLQMNRRIGTADEARQEPVRPTAAAVHGRSDERGIPVLLDEVPQGQFLQQLRSTPPPPVPITSSTPASLARRDEDSAEDSSPTVQMTGTRSRLMRMKNRGLFKND
jgi:hypothetical protein